MLMKNKCNQEKERIVNIIKINKTQSMIYNYDLYLMTIIEKYNEV
ncbi:MAG: hypothetical protein K0S67_1098 [Nitrososphaeraceae archaeon]|jgi:hypothetical protein|nr:hypothetical protein [Nitrososphaeraceae archaeon]